MKPIAQTSEEATNACVERTDANGVATLTLNRPHKLNALNGLLFQALDAHLQAIEADMETVGVVVLRGAGQCFSVGADLSEAADGVETVTSLRKSQIVERLGRLPQPVIAAVHGHCYTGALELALAADLIVAADSALFADTHARWGLTPAWGMSQRLPRRVGRAQAMRMMLTCSPIPAAEARAIGLADLCVPDAQWQSQVDMLCASICANSWFSHRANKRLMVETDGLPLSAGLAHEFFQRPGKAPDFNERVARFARQATSAAPTAGPSR